jgi:hypothetical protein
MKFMKLQNEIPRSRLNQNIKDQAYESKTLHPQEEIEMFRK